MTTCTQNIFIVPWEPVADVYVDDHILQNVHYFFWKDSGYFLQVFLKKIKESFSRDKQNVMHMSPNERTEWIITESADQSQAKEQLRDNKFNEFCTSQDLEHVTRVKSCCNEDSSKILGGLCSMLRI